MYSLLAQAEQEEPSAEARGVETGHTLVFLVLESY